MPTHARPTTIGDLSPAALRQTLASGLRFRVGAFSISARSRLSAVAAGIAAVYPDYPILVHDAFIDFTVCVAAPLGVRAVLRAQVNFQFDGYQPFKPLPLAQAFPLFEWGLNWCAANHAHQYVITHAAVVEKAGRALILPGSPGSGKSTLCAALVQRGGWRLLSDELTLTDPNSGMVAPSPRPISLKNESIDVIRRFAPESIFSAATHDTLKGTVALLRVPHASIARAGEAVLPAWLVFPKYQAASASDLTPLGRGPTLMRLADNTFNYSVLGLTAFNTLGDLVHRCDCYDFTYSDLDDALRIFDDLAAT